MQAAGHNNATASREVDAALTGRWLLRAMCTRVVP
jgi:hypothetical protein